MKKLLLLFSLFFGILLPNLADAQRTDFDSADKAVNFRCFCTYQVTHVNPDSEYYNPESNPTDFLETDFLVIMPTQNPLNVSVGEKINFCQEEARKKGLGNAQCFTEKPVQLTELEDDFKFKAPDLTVGIPGFEGFSAPPTTWNKESGAVYFTWIGEYIKAIYNFSLVAISILAVLMIIIQGIKIISSGLGGDRKEAYKRISQAVIGLLLAWGSYTLLYMINPNLLKFEGLEVKVITPQDIKSIVDHDADNGKGVPVEFAAGETCIPLNELFDISKLVALGNVSYPVLQKDAYDGLAAAVAEAKKQNEELLITSAFRDLKTQKAIWETKFAEIKKQMPNASDEEIAKVTKKYAAPPSCRSPHLTGKAIDVCIKGSSICQKIDIMYAQTQNMTADEKADVEKLKKIMKAAGWKNYIAEWWHYEYNCEVCPTANRI